MRFRRLFDLSVHKNCLVGEMFVSGLEEGARLDSGVGGCGVGRMTWFGSVGCCCLILFCRSRFLTDVIGTLTTVAILSVVCTIWLLQMTVRCWIRFPSLFGTNMFRLKCLSLHGVFAATGCLRNLI